MIEHLYSVNGLTQILHLKDDVAATPAGLEMYEGVLCGRKRADRRVRVCRAVFFREVRLSGL